VSKECAVGLAFNTHGRNEECIRKVSRKIPKEMTTWEAVFFKLAIQKGGVKA